MDQQASIGREITPGAVVTAPPDWVDRAPYDIPDEPNPHFIANGVCVLLDDSQIDLCGTERGWYYRRAELVTAPAGAERAAQFSVNFDPSFERIEVHSVAVIRGGQRIEHAETAFYEVLRRERNLERLHFDGRLTIHVTLPDVRAGDVVETSYTVYGMRKALNGRHSVFIPLEWPVGIIDVRLRQRSPKQRTIAERGYNDAPEGAQTEADGIIDRRWRAIERPGFRYEPLAPPWMLQSAALQLSEWRDWAEVAAAFAPLYDEAAPLPDDVEQEIARISQNEKKPAARAAAVLRFTQGAVRYLAISMGEGGYTPRGLSEIGATRYGDCKDKTKLFVLMARRLGVDACPALVNTRDGYALADWLPSGQVFDHCIVRVAVDGKVYWLDPTRQVQPSPLDKLSQCHFGWALPLREGQSKLERMPDPPVPQLIETQEKIVLGSYEAPAHYEWTHTFRDARAEAMREQLAREGEVSVFRSYAEDLQRTWPKAKVIEQKVVSDDIAANTIVVREAYEIPDAWTHAGGGSYNFTTRDFTIAGTLAPLDPGERRHEIYLGQPGRRTRRVEVRTAKKHEGGWQRDQRGSTLRHSDDMRVVDSRQLVIEQVLEIKALTLPAKEAEVYRNVVANIGKNELVITESDLKAGQPVSFWSVARWVLIALFVIYWLGRFAGAQ